MTRKMQIFYTVILFLVLTGFFSVITKVVFTSDNIANIIMMVMAFATAMGAANFGEHWTDMKKEQAKNGKTKKT